MAASHPHADEWRRRRRSTAEQVEGLGLFDAAPRPMPLAYAGGSDTSEDAAESQASRAEQLRERALRAYRDAGARGLTADECARVLGATVLAVRPRVTELRQLGWITRTGERRRNESGLNASVLVITDGGARRAS